jgi:hypothetical protein
MNLPAKPDTPSQPGIPSLAAAIAVAAQRLNTMAHRIETAMVGGQKGDDCAKSYDATLYGGLCETRDLLRMTEATLSRIEAALELTPTSHK